jgi:hypothetical protein
MFSQTLPVVANPGHFMTLTAADPLGNTSEFSACAPIGLDTDGDSFGTMMDGLPIYGDQREQMLGTDPNLACAATPIGNDEPTDPYPPDTDDDGFVDITDVSAITGRFGEAQTPANIRYELNLDGFIDITDVSLITARFGEACPP